ncbi:MAG: peptide ABC transporter substrate-binding protein [Armatimonadota bacterium]|nr:peptide ABC transporter substrate-binding protein [Armatimonadota bacterium]MDW8103782.1 peptide ABC transporter substrate-binding protein [Armatimonadota bacterium]MDW8290645.1 peptide ABC transporter substrate-binding protein [Armatimonadota bacterium]
MHRYAVGLVVALLVVLSAGGCGRRQASAPPAQNVLRYALTTEPTTFDPALVRDGPTIDMLFHVFEGLVQWDENNRLQPNLAESWEVSADGRVYTFRLKRGVKFHNGREVTAEDFKYSIERACDPELASPVSATYLNDIVGALDKLERRANEVKGVEVVDKYTLRITIDHPKAYFLAKLTYPTAYVVCREAIEQEGDEVNGRRLRINERCAIGTGPFKIAQYVPGSKVVLAANKEYHAGAPQLDGIERPIVLDASTRHAMYERGDLDIVDVQKGDLLRDQQDPVLSKQLHTFDRAAVFYLGLNQNAFPPFKDRRVRLALAYATDKDAIVRVALMGVPQKANGILPPGVLAHDPNFQGIPYDPERARQLLAEAGYPGGKGFPTLVLTFREKTPDLRRAAEMVKEQYRKELGINVELREMEWGAFLDALDRKELPFIHLRWMADYLDAQNFLSVLLRSGAPENVVGYSNPRFDALCDQADKERDEAKRIRLYREAERIAVEDVPWIPLYFQRDVELIKPYVKGIRDSLMGHLPHVTTRIER